VGHLGAQYPSLLSERSSPVATYSVGLAVDMVVPLQFDYTSNDYRYLSVLGKHTVLLLGCKDTSSTLDINTKWPAYERCNLGADMWSMLPLVFLSL
jgi:hypothetical protein